MRITETGSSCPICNSKGQAQPLFILEHSDLLNLLLKIEIICIVCGYKTDLKQLAQKQPKEIER